MVFADRIWNDPDHAQPEPMSAVNSVTIAKLIDGKVFIQQADGTWRRARRPGIPVRFQRRGLPAFTARHQGPHTAGQFG
jgi:hypothetical protein